MTSSKGSLFNCPHCNGDLSHVSESDAKTLDKPAIVGNTRFGVGVSERMVVERAQREYEYQTTPEKEGERLERVKAFTEALHGPTKIICAWCGADRLKTGCQAPDPSFCKMVAQPFSTAVREEGNG
jgi:hypothetical protein